MENFKYVCDGIYCVIFVGGNEKVEDMFAIIKLNQIDL